MIEITIAVNGMQCGMCESHVSDAVRRVCDAKKVTSSHVKNQTVVVASDDTDPAQIASAIRAQGYEVGDISVKPYEKPSLFQIFKKK